MESLSSICPSVCPKADHNIYWLTKPDFWKKKKIGGHNLSQIGQNRVQNFFAIFSSLVHYFSLN